MSTYILFATNRAVEIVRYRAYRVFGTVNSCLVCIPASNARQNANTWCGAARRLDIVFWDSNHGSFSRDSEVSVRRVTECDLFPSLYTEPYLLTLSTIPKTILTQRLGNSPAAYFIQRYDKVKFSYR